MAPLLSCGADKRHMGTISAFSLCEPGSCISTAESLLIFSPGGRRKSVDATSLSKHHVANFARSGREGDPLEPNTVSIDRLEPDGGQFDHRKHRTEMVPSWVWLLATQG